MAWENDLKEAIENFDVKKISKFSREQLISNLSQLGGYRALGYACWKGNLDVVKKIAKTIGKKHAKTEAGFVTSDGWSPLHSICRNEFGRFDHAAIKYLITLLDDHAELMLIRPLPDNRMALHLICQNKSGCFDTKAVEVVLDALAKKAFDMISSQLPDGYTPLHLVCQNTAGKFDSKTVEILFSRLGSRILDVTLLETANVDNILSLVAVNPKFTRELLDLVLSGLGTHAKYLSRRRIKSGKSACDILKENHDINLQEIINTIPKTIKSAIDNDDIKTLSKFSATQLATICFDTEENTNNQKNYRALIYACWKSNFKIVKKIVAVLEKQAQDEAIYSIDDMTALHWVCWNDKGNFDTKALKLILDVLGSEAKTVIKQPLTSIWGVEWQGWTPIHLVAYNSQGKFDSDAIIFLTKALGDDASEILQIQLYNGYNALFYVCENTSKKFSEKAIEAIVEGLGDALDAQLKLTLPATSYTALHLVCENVCKQFNVNTILSLTKAMSAQSRFSILSKALPNGKTAFHLVCENRPYRHRIVASLKALLYECSVIDAKNLLKTSTPDNTTVLSLVSRTPDNYSAIYFVLENLASEAYQQLNLPIIVVPYENNEYIGWTPLHFICDRQTTDAIKFGKRVCGSHDNEKFNATYPGCYKSPKHLYAERDTQRTFEEVTAVSFSQAFKISEDKYWSWAWEHENNLSNARMMHQLELDRQRAQVEAEKQEIFRQQALERQQREREIEAEHQARREREIQLEQAEKQRKAQQEIENIRKSEERYKQNKIAERDVYEAKILQEKLAEEYAKLEAEDKNRIQEYHAQCKKTETKRQELLSKITPALSAFKEGKVEAKAIFRMLTNLIESEYEFSEDLYLIRAKFHYFCSKNCKNMPIKITVLNSALNDFDSVLSGNPFHPEAQKAFANIRKEINNLELEMKEAGMEAIVVESVRKRALMEEQIQSHLSQFRANG